MPSGDRVEQKAASKSTANDEKKSDFAVPPQLSRDLIPPEQFRDLVEISTLIYNFIDKKDINIFGKIESLVTPHPSLDLLTLDNILGHFIVKQLAESQQTDLADPLRKATYQLALLEQMPMWTNRLATSKNYRRVKSILKSIDDQSSDQSIRTALCEMEGLIVGLKSAASITYLEPGYRKLGADELDKIRQLKKNLPLNKNKVIAALNQAFVAKTRANWDGQNIILIDNAMFTRNVELIQETLDSALHGKPAIAKKVFSLPIFKSLLPDDQTQMRPEKSIFAKASASLSWGLIMAAATTIVAFLHLFSIYIVTGGRLLRTPLNAFYNSLFQREALLPTLKTDLKELGKAIASTVLSPLFIFSPLLGLIKGLIGGFYYGSLKNGIEIFAYYMSSRLSPKTIADEIEIYDRQCRQNSSTAEIGGSLGGLAIGARSEASAGYSRSSTSAQSSPQPDPGPNPHPVSTVASSQGPSSFKP